MNTHHSKEQLGPAKREELKAKMKKLKAKGFTVFADGTWLAPATTTPQQTKTSTDSQPVANRHCDTVMMQDNWTANYHQRSWSYRFTCGNCGAHRRANTNYLGRRGVIICNGVTTTIKREKV